MRATAFLLAALLLPPRPGAAAERWSASSQTASAITGDVQFGPGEIRFGNGRSLKLGPAEKLDGFRVDGAPVAAQLYPVLEPADPVLQGGNRLCGARGHEPVPVRALVVWRPVPIPGVDLPSRGLAVYSGTARPRSDSDRDLCGTYFYDAPPAAPTPDRRRP